MKTLRRFVRRSTSWLTSTRDEERLRAEFEEHIALQTAENLRAGLSPVEARRQALLRFGSVEAIKEIYRDQRRLPFIETVLADTRHALRRMRRAPAFTSAVIVTLALGIGANTAAFGVIDSILIRPLAYPRADALISVRHAAPGSAETVMLTYGYWQRRFGGDTSIVGRTLTIDSRPRTVIGVMSEAFRFQRDPELILPQRFDRSTQFLANFGFQAIARLKPGITIEQAGADVGRLVGVWLNTWPPNPGSTRAIFENARFEPKLQPLKQDVVGEVSTALWVVMGTLGLLLLIACANVANLLLVRAESRQQEFAIRAALGAGRGRIAREMLVESITLGVLGGALGLGLAYAALRILVVRGPDTLPRLNEIGIDPLVLSFAFGVSLLSGVVFGAIPIVKYAGPRIAPALRGIGRTVSQDREGHRARHVLVVVQVALALVLLIGSGLMIRTFQHLRGVQPGFTHPEEILILHALIPAAIAGEPERVMRMQHEILDRLAAIPGVTSVGFGSRAPLESVLGGNSNPIEAEGKTVEQGRVPPLRQIRRTAPGYFKTMGTRVVAGRDFSWADLYDSRRVAIVSENLAREWWGDPGAALGKRIREIGAADPWREIIGVVENVYDDGVQAKPPEVTYWPALMDRYIWGGENGSAVVAGMFAIRSNRTGAEGLLAEAQQAIWSLNGRQPVFLVTTLKELYDRSMARTSFTLVMLAIAGGMGLVLGIVGIYGVIAYVVSQRIREIGIRIALGAQPAGLLAMFVRYGLWLAGMGAAVGLVAAAGLTRLMSSLLFGVTGLDPVTYTAVSMLLIVAGVLASYLPARRAIAVDPVQALRAE
jgi:predicted permease